jgi:hypothetical protein
MALLAVAGGLGVGVAVDAAAAAGNAPPELGWGSWVCGGLFLLWIVWGFIALSCDSALETRTLLALFLVPGVIGLVGVAVCAATGRPSGALGGCFGLGLMALSVLGSLTTHWLRGRSPAEGDDGVSDGQP